MDNGDNIHFWHNNYLHTRPLTSLCSWGYSHSPYARRPEYPQYLKMETAYGLSAQIPMLYRLECLRLSMPKELFHLGLARKVTHVSKSPPFGILFVTKGRLSHGGNCYGFRVRFLDSFIGWVYLTSLGTNVGLIGKIQINTPLCYFCTEAIE